MLINIWIVAQRHQRTPFCFQFPILFSICPLYILKRSILWRNMERNTGSIKEKTRGCQSLNYSEVENE